MSALAKEKRKTRAVAGSYSDLSEGEAEAALVDRAKGGDRKAFRILVERYQRRLLGFIFTMAGSWEDAEDIAQESFVRAYFSLKNFRKDSSFYTWLCRIAYNMTIDLKRKSLKKQKFFSIDENDDRGLKEVAASDNPAADLYRKEAGMAIERAMDRLSEEHRSVIFLREIEGMSYKEIAKVTGTSSGTVMSRIHYAKKALQSMLKKYRSP
ncbi:MAG: sigma-70 family RNA polymerase sigma factor [Candidatus Dadabacteria bacterium]|nr:MAG: sigma-70 family RNA polymerase sigma factor [Candidatus Dadabacteria bacterium]